MPRRFRQTLALLAIILTASLATAPIVAAANATNISVRLPAGHTISGTITRATGGAAVVGASVTAFGANGYSFANTTANGSYVLKGLKNGSYTISIVPPNENLKSGYYRNTGVNHFTTDPSLASPVTINNNNRTGINVRLPGQTLYSISGKITRSSNGTAVVGASVTAFGSDSGSANTNASGNFTVGGLVPGTYRLAVSPPFGMNLQTGCYRSTPATHFTSNCAMGTTMTISNANLTGKNVALPRGLILTGTVTDRSASPVTFAYITAAAQGNLYSPSGFTDGAGAFEIIGLSPGTFKVQVSAPADRNLLDGYYSSTAPNYWTRLAGSATVVTMSADRNLPTIKPANGFTISGRIQNSTGVNLQYASVAAFGSNGFAATSSAANGTFSLIGLPAGSYTVQITKPFDRPTLQSGWYRSSLASGFTPNLANATPVTLGPNQTGVIVKLPAGFEISGKITKAPAVAVANVLVIAKRTTTGQTWVVVTNASGNYLFQGLPAGTFKVQANGVIEQNLVGGWYRSGVPGNYTAGEAQATVLTIGP